MNSGDPTLNKPDHIFLFQDQVMGWWHWSVKEHLPSTSEVTLDGLYCGVGAEERVG